ncbi:RluA family pseudouridine synthase [Ligilactobacillus equi]|uniref:Pseudouridine synthase n=1 Tax=Ligilactobacillus equi DPC 6820 TaxID=1392007 RepID=V7HYK2_9LACO|nr:RluA family pseudouridine synthase [Ligilactobacillus equi]ETA74350.1 ribosomal large subunit pseudouridine synthase D [Ligilactobacillus equi DPC 6820]
MIEEKIVTIENESGRLDKVAAQVFSTLSRSQLKKLLAEGHLTVNNQVVKAKYKVQAGDVIKVMIPEPKHLDIVAEKMDLDIVYEDEDVLVVNKPQGMVVHPAPGHESGTLVNGLLAHSPLSTINGTFRPGIVHRIDKDTSGLLMVAKNDLAHQSLAQQLKEKTNLREYLALVHGNLKENEGTIDAPIGRHPIDRKRQAVVKDGRQAVTHFKVRERFGDYTLVSCRLETGRTHQIRVHMKYIGHALVGDPVYGPKKTITGKGQFLHAAKLGFTHPRTGEWLEFEAPLPDVFAQTLDRLEKSFKKI